MTFQVLASFGAIRLKVWSTPLTRKLDIPPVTKRVLRELEARVAAGFGHALPAPFYRVLHGKFTCVML